MPIPLWGGPGATDKIDTSATTGTAVNAYNAALENARKEFCAQLGAFGPAEDGSAATANSLIKKIVDMELRNKSGTQTYTTVTSVVNTQDFDYDAIDLITQFMNHPDTDPLTVDNLKELKAAIYKAQENYTKALLSVMSYNSTGVAADKNIMRSSSGGREAGQENLWDDALHLSNIGIEFYEDTVSTARDYLENGLPGASWADASTGSVDGRRNLHSYVRRKFEEYLTPDKDKLTNDQSYKIMERSGNSFIKLLGVHYTDANGNITTQNRAFLDATSYKKDQAYEISYLKSGLTEQYMRAKDGEMKLIKRFGDGSWRYQTDVISDLYAGEYVYSKFDPETEGGGLRTDLRGGLRTFTLRDDTIPGDPAFIPSPMYDNTDMSVRNMREEAEYQGMPSTVRSWDDYKLITATSFSKFLVDYDATNKEWKDFVYSTTEREGYLANKVFERTGLSMGTFENVFKTAYTQEAKLIEAAGELDRMEDAILYMRGVLSGLDVELYGQSASPASVGMGGGFGPAATASFSAAPSSVFKPTFDKEVKLRLSRLDDLTRFNVVSRLRQAMEVTGMTQAKGRVDGIDVRYIFDPEVTTWDIEGAQAGILYATVPGRHPSEGGGHNNVFTQIDGAIHATGATHISATTIEGHKVFVQVKAL
ncbi:hypothetical protein ACFL42_05175, partial [Candidatus Omnitrophota bacterium]